MLAEDPIGMDWLLQMDLVGVGGAALLQNVGDSLVTKGVNLVSRFGSAEYGLLPSSRRPFETEKVWQYLRVSSFIRFEAQIDGSRLFELMILKARMAIKNQRRSELRYE
jgi:hypothetical protein